MVVLSVTVTTGEWDGSAVCDSYYWGIEVLYTWKLRCIYASGGRGGDTCINEERELEKR